MQTQAIASLNELIRPILLELVEQIIVHENGELDIVFKFSDSFKEAQQITTDTSA